MPVNELGKLFPIKIVDYSEQWVQLFYEESKLITASLPSSAIIKIDHIGSTAIPGLKSKPTIDILLQISEQADIQKLKETFESLDYMINEHPENPPPHFSYVKGYSQEGYTGQAYHVHVRYQGDWNEIRFRDYLIAHPELAKEYEVLKLELAEKYRNDREAYTDGKTEWINGVNARARE